MNASAPVSQTSLASLVLVRRGKVRDVYAVDEEHLLIVATDRISAFDCILPTQISRKGEVLTAISRFWFERLAHLAPHHLVTTEIEHMPDSVRGETAQLRGRSMFVKRTEVFPVECVVRGYLAGSGWKDYQRTGQICGHRLPPRLREAEQLPAPLFTPATKAAEGHDENVSVARMAEIIGAEAARQLRDTSLALYRAAETYARSRGIIIADTKFEFGLDRDGRTLLIDEVLTPDSSRFWPLDQYAPGCGGDVPASFDKQFVRDYLETLDWNKRPPAPPLPPEVAAAVTARYLEAYRLLTGKSLGLSVS